MKKSTPFFVLTTLLFITLIILSVFNTLYTVSPILIIIISVLTSLSSQFKDKIVNKENKVENSMLNDSIDAIKYYYRSSINLHTNLLMNMERASKSKAIKILKLSGLKASQELQDNFKSAIWDK